VLLSFDLAPPIGLSSRKALRTCNRDNSTLNAGYPVQSRASSRSAAPHATLPCDEAIND